MKRGRNKRIEDLILDFVDKNINIYEKTVFFEEYLHTICLFPLISTVLHACMAEN